MASDLVERILGPLGGERLLYRFTENYGEEVALIDKNYEPLEDVEFWAEEVLPEAL